MKKFPWLSMLAGVACGSLSLVASAQFGQPQQQQQQQQQPQAQQQSPRGQVIATVNGEPIMQEELQRQMQARMQQQGAAAEPQQVQKQALDSLVEARLIEQYAVEQGPGANPQEVEQQIQQIRQQLQSQNVSLEQFLQSQGQSEEQLRERITASLAWQKLLEQEMTPQNLQQFFQQNQDQFQADDFQQAQREVQQRYTAKVWDDIVKEMKPKAEIEVVQQPRANAPQQNSGLQRQQPQQR